MPVTITNTSGLRLSVPSPVNDILEIGEQKTYDHVEWDEAVNDERIDEMIQKGQITVEKAGAEYETPEATSSSLEIWVATTGDDRGGDGTDANPYATLTKAMENVPNEINHTVHIRIAAGTYTETLSQLTRSFGNNGFLCIEGIGDPTVHAGPFTVTAFASLTAYSYITVSGTPWTPDEYYGKWARVTAGTALGYIFPIHTNTNNTINTPWVHTGTVGTITEIEILEGPPVSLICENGLVMSGSNLALTGGLTAGDARNCAHLAVAGIRFKTDSESYYGFTIDRLSAWFAFTVFENPSPTVNAYIFPLLLSHSYINVYFPHDTAVFDNVLYNLDYFGGIMVKRGDTAYTGSSAAFGTVIQQSFFQKLTDRFRVAFWFAAECYRNSFGLLIGSNVANYAVWTLIDPVGLASTSYYPLSAFGNGAFYGVYLHIERTYRGSAVSVGAGQSVRLTSPSCNAANVPDYGARISAGGKLVIGSPSGLTGGLNDAYFVQTSTATAWPAAGTAVTDSQGAWIIV